VRYTAGASVTSSPGVADGVVYFGTGSDDDRVYALNATTGAQLWTFTTGNGVASSPAVANGIVYAGSYDDNLYAFTLPNGTPSRRAAWASPRTTNYQLEERQSISPVHSAQPGQDAVKRIRL
jgi:outer membrane protein assembly factor BamB